MALRLISLILLLPVTMANAYWASGLENNALYSASQNDGICRSVRGLTVLGVVLPWLFLVLSVSAAVQIVFMGRFGLSAALLGLHLMHMTLLIGLLVLGNGYCRGPGFFAAFPALTELALFGVVVALVPLPVLIAQLRAMRFRRLAGDRAL